MFFLDTTKSVYNFLVFLLVCLFFPKKGNASDIHFRAQVVRWVCFQKLACKLQIVFFTLLALSRSRSSLFEIIPFIEEVKLGL